MGKLIGIRKEDKSVWEKRVPLIPDHVATLFHEHQIRTRLQSFPTRAFSDQAYLQAGAEIDNDLTPCTVILAVKEIPVSAIIPEKPYLFFSHTIKGQKQNMPLLKAMIDLKCTLIDYECIPDGDNKRLVFFGRYAGLAGIIDAFNQLGKRLQYQGIESPFTGIKAAHEYQSLKQAKTEIVKVAKEIETSGLAQQLAPFVIGIAGYGQVSRGAQEILDLFPLKTVTADELLELDESNNKTLYKVVFAEEDLVEPTDPEFSFSLRHYYVHPVYYRSKFNRYLDSLSLVVNAIYWDERYPRLIKKSDLKPEQKLLLVADISCDINGAIEFTEKSNSSDQPSFVYNPVTDTISDGIEGPGTVVVAIDNLPTELPLDASAAFSKALVQFMPSICHADFSQPFDKLDLADPIKNAVIVHQGKLTPEYTHLKSFLNNG